MSSEPLKPRHESFRLTNGSSVEDSLDESVVAAYFSAVKHNLLACILSALMLDGGRTLRAFPFISLAFWSLTLLLRAGAREMPRPVVLSFIKYGIWWMMLVFWLI